ncbi:MAG: Ig-like domain-containing protein, partial [Candidatus Binataceae bacterium]
MNEHNRVASGVRAASLGAILTILLLAGGLAAAQTAPVQITSPSNNAQVSGAVNFTVAPGSGVGWVDFDVDNQIIGATPGLTKVWNTANATPGTHVLEAFAYAQPDTLLGTARITVTVVSGNSNTSDNASGSGGPVQIISPANDAQVSGIVDFTATKGQGVSWINFYVDNQFLASSPALTKAWNTATVTPGTHVLSIRGYAQPHTLVGSAQVSVVVGGATSTPTPTATPTAIPTAIATPTATPTAIPTATPTATPTAVPTSTATPTSTPTPTATPTIAPTPTATPTMTESGNLPVQITSPTNNAQVNGDVNFTVVEGKGVGWVDFHVDGQIIGATPGLTKVWNTAGVQPGPHVLEASAYAQPHTLLGTAQVTVLVNPAATPTPSATPT